MTNIPFKGRGTFPLYFRHPENINPLFDLLGFSQGFRRAHPSGLTFYIHRTKNKKEVAPFGLTVPLLVDNLNDFSNVVQKLPQFILEPSQWFGNPAILINITEQKKFLIIQENQLLPPQTNYQGKQSNVALQGNGVFILNSKNPEKAADWYESFLECETVYRSEKMTISIMTNFNESTPGLIIFHQLETDSKKIGPLKDRKSVV